MSHDFFKVLIDTNIKISDAKTGEILHEGSNAIHPQNVARVLARALANEPNSKIFRMAFGNGGSYIDAIGNTVFNPPNTGEVDGWQSRLYNEVYSEIVDETDINFREDLGSADSANIRVGGGSSASDDPPGGGTESVEVGLKSNVTITLVLNENEPSGQLLTDDLGVTMENYEKCFLFDEIGLYSPGKQARNTNGYTTVDVNNKTSTDNSNLTPLTTYNLNIVIDGTSYTCEITTPASGSGTSGELTYGDICEGINDGSWISSGNSINDYAFVYITDNSEGTYPSIVNKQSYGYLTFQSKTTGASSTIEVTCNNSPYDFFYVLTGNDCSDCNINQVPGDNAGVQNDPINPENERERLLTHFIFSPIIKSSNRSIKIVYTLTISIRQTTDTEVFVNIN